MRSHLRQAQRNDFARCSCNILGALVRLAVALLIVMMMCGFGLTAATPGAPTSLNGVVKDSLGNPVADASVTLRAIDGRTVARTSTDSRGEFKLPANQRGTFDLVVRRTGFDPANMVVMLPGKGGKPLVLVLGAKQALTLPVSASRIHVQNQLTATGNSRYTFTARDITNLPQGEATPLNQVLLQMPGVALDQNQEIHVRGEHAGIQYQMNGILLPLDINVEAKT